MIFELSDPIQYTKEGEIVFPGDPDFSGDKPWNFSRIDLIGHGEPGEIPGAPGEVVEYDGVSFFYKHEATAGEILVASLLLVVIIFLFIDLVLQRILPRFIRFWK